MHKRPIELQCTKEVHVLGGTLQSLLTLIYKSSPPHPSPPFFLLQQNWFGCNGWGLLSIFLKALNCIRKEVSVVKDGSS